VGAGSIILPGVTIWDGAIICAGSNIPAYTLVWGIPAKVIRNLDSLS
jgi:acetyltransferase-like isoleucine patch superfamily enzyme